MLNNVYNFTYATTLDFIMDCYNISLTGAANKICTTNTTFEKYEYKRLPVVLCIAPVIFQYKMSALMDDFNFVRVYLKYLLIITY